MNGHWTWLDLAVLVVYFAAMLGVGYYFYHGGRSRTPEGFTAAGRSMPGWAVGLSILATYLSSISFLALPGNAYGSNWNAFTFSLSLPLAAWVAVKWFLPYYRATGEVSAYSHLEKRFGPWARVYAGLCYLLTQLARMGAVMLLMAMALSVLLGWDIRVVILITGASVILYTLLGGIVAVIWTDAIQAIVLTAGAVLCAALMLFGLPEGPGQLFEIAGEHNKFSLGSFGPSLAESTFWVVLIYGLVINLQNFGIDQNYVQRYVTSRSSAEARKSIWLGALLYVPISAVFFFIGTALFAYYTAQPDLLPAAVEEEGADYVFPYYIVEALPPGVTGLLIAAIFAAAMSTLSTSLNSSATLLMTDYYRRFIRPGAGEREQMMALYGGTLLWGCLGTAIGMALVGVQYVLDAWWTLSGIFAGGMLGLFLLGLLSRRAGNPQAILGVVLGVLVIFWMSVSPDAGWWPEGLRSPFHHYLVIVFGTLTILLTGFLAASLASGPANDNDGAKGGGG